MKLKEYLDEYGIPMTVFARKIGVSDATISNILYRDKDLRLSTALRIEAVTKSQVTCVELLPAKFLSFSPKEKLNKTNNRKNMNEKKMEHPKKPK